jgi:hypothetical protein
MSDTQERKGYTSDEAYPIPGKPRHTMWAGTVVFAGVMLLLLGGFQIVQGIVAIVNDDYYVVTNSGLVVTLDYTVWGWFHLILGLIALAAGVGVMLGQMWARVVGIVVAGVGALANMTFLPAYPIWATIIIAVDVLVIYALAVHGRDVQN